MKHEDKVFAYEQPTDVLAGSKVSGILLNALARAAASKPPPPAALQLRSGQMTRFAGHAAAGIAQKQDQAEA